MIPFQPRSTVSLVAVLAIASTSAAAAAPDTLACEGAFAKDTTHTKLVEAFGKSNVP
jgi:hypothetical protein